jgi:hypothetical protein
VAALAGTGILLSSHGGDLAGLPFLPPGASVIEAFPYLMDFEGYRHLAEAAGLRYARLAGPPPTEPDEALRSMQGLQLRVAQSGGGGAGGQGSHGSAQAAAPPEAPPLPLPLSDAERSQSWHLASAAQLLEPEQFEQLCEDPQRVPSLDASLVVACNARSKNSAVEVRAPLPPPPASSLSPFTSAAAHFTLPLSLSLPLSFRLLLPLSLWQLDWPALVRALVQALDDIGCRPRQFTALQARAIRRAQAEAGLTGTLWEGWEQLGDSEPPERAPNPLAAAPQPSSSSSGPSVQQQQQQQQALLASLGLTEEDLAAAEEEQAFEEEEGASGGQSLQQAAELWGLEPAPSAEAAAAAALPSGLGTRGISSKGLNLLDIHLVPVSGGDGFEGSQLPFINVRAKCAHRKRLWKDASPWRRR